jgi:8-oxo-dGTP diphosphatase
VAACGGAGGPALAEALTIRAAGSVLWRRGADGVEVAVVHRPRYDDWSLPKGKAHPGEPLAVTARRETVEETGWDVALGRWLGVARYRVDGEEKRVDYWSARAGDMVGGVDPGEVDEVRWLPETVARQRLSWDHDRTMLDRLAPVPTTTVLLVRHARAGAREAWHGPDDERPLDLAGRAQAAALGSLLPSFWLAAERPVVVSAPVVRCVDTVAWADDVKTDERLGERTFADDPEAAVAAVRELAGHGVAVACSQGGVIPAVVEALRREDGLSPAGVRAAKGSAWVLSFAGGRLVATDYLDVG